MSAGNLGNLLGPVKYTGSTSVNSSISYNNSLNHIKIDNMNHIKIGKITVEPFIPSNCEAYFVSEQLNK